MIIREELSRYLNTLLDCASYQDYAPNGLQVAGRSCIENICTAVTASYEVIEQAILAKADALIVHHGYFWKGEDPTLTGMKRQRVAQLIQHDLNLFAYHLPLDCHLSLGNNAGLANYLQATHVTQHSAGGIVGVLWSGQLPEAIDAAVLSQLLTKQLQRKPLHIAGNQKPIRRLAWCSGGAQDFIVEAHQLGVDAYLSGEISERTFYQAKELGIHYFACGHHASERYGVQALGQHLSHKFSLAHQFIDSDNPV